MKKAKKNLFYFAVTSFVILSMVIFLPASVNAQGYSTMSNPWLGGYGVFSSTTSSPWGYTAQGFTQSNPASTPPVYACSTQSNPASTIGVRGGESTTTSDINDDTYFLSGWVDTMIWYRQSLDMYGWKPWDMTGGVNANLWNPDFSTNIWNSGIGGGSLTTSSTFAGCVGNTFLTCYTNCKIEKEEPKFPNSTLMTCNSYCKSGQTMLAFPGPIPNPYPFPDGGLLYESNSSFNFSSNFPSQSPAW